MRSLGRINRVALVLGVVGLIAVTSGALSLTLLDDDDDAPDAQTTTTTSLPGSDDEETTTSTSPASIEELQGDARELAELLAEGRSRTYHATYEGSSSGASAGSIALESWAKDGRFRQDVAFEVGGISVQRSTFVLDDRGVSCQRSGEEPWTCNDLPRSDVQGADPLTGGTLAQLRDAAVGEVVRDVAGRRARCFTVSFDAQTTEMCVSEEGIPLQVRAADAELVVGTLEDQVDDDVFTPPAPST
jgi:hypothetical protein